MKERNLKIQPKKFIIQVKLFFQIFQLKNYHFVNILVGKKTEQLLIRPIELYELSHSNLKSL